MTKLFLLLALPLSIFAQSKKVDSVKVFYLGGQSNMDGYGYNKDLPKSLNKKIKNVYIFHGNPTKDERTDGGKGIWTSLKPGHGRGFSSDANENKLSNRFGVELSFAQKLQEIYPNQKIALIKYSRGGTSIDTLGNPTGNWDSNYRGKTGKNQYDYFLETVKNAYAQTDIDGDGITDVLVPSGIIWMQGESDAKQEDIALRYYQHLDKLMNLIRAAFRVDDLPVVIGKISDSWNNDEGKVWKYGEIVQAAQEKFALTDKNATIVRDTRYYKYSDRYHYNSEGYIDLGIKFAEALEKLKNK
ncbi:sialate O-acetylesterase [Wenyingzhuangia sp. IMCC45467]